jgi:hypothetical protein
MVRSPEPCEHNFSRASRLVGYALPPEDPQQDNNNGARKDQFEDFSRHRFTQYMMASLRGQVGISIFR